MTEPIIPAEYAEVVARYPNCALAKLLSSKALHITPLLCETPGVETLCRYCQTANPITELRQTRGADREPPSSFDVAMSAVLAAGENKEYHSCIYHSK